MLRSASTLITKGLSQQKQGSQEDVTSPTLRFLRSPFSSRRSSSDPTESSIQELAQGHSRDTERGRKGEKFVIALLGPSGAGKSSFIAHATGQNVRIGHLLTACTQTIDTYEKQLPDGRTVVFVDTPGYDLAEKNPNRVLNMLTQWLKAQSSRGTRITFNAILFFHRINDNRMPVATQSHIHRFEKLVGKKGAQKRVLLITTMWDDIDLRIGASRELQLKTDYWQRFIEGGSSVCRFNRNHSSAWDILNPLLGVAKVEGVPIPAVFDSVFQEEMEEEAEMDAHQALTAMEQIYLDQQRLVEKLQDAILDPRGEQTEVLREVLAEERKVSEKIGSLLGRLKRQNLRWFRFNGSDVPQT